MPVELREITIHATRPHDPVGYVQFFAGDGANLEQSEQWITGQVPAGLPAMKPIALLQIVTLQRARGGIAPTTVELGKEALPTLSR